MVLVPTDASDNCIVSLASEPHSPASEPV